MRALEKYGMFMISSKFYFISCARLLEEFIFDVYTYTYIAHENSQ